MYALALHAAKTPRNAVLPDGIRPAQSFTARPPLRVTHASTPHVSPPRSWQKLDPNARLGLFPPHFIARCKPPGGRQRSAVRLVQQPHRTDTIPYVVYSAASIVARYFSMFPAPSSHCQKSSPEPSGMSELVVVVATTGAAAEHTGGEGASYETRWYAQQRKVWHLCGLLRGP